MLFIISARYFYFIANIIFLTILPYEMHHFSAQENDGENYFCVDAGHI